ncbi:hypothetical protein Tcan_12273 [Toxocara canis]|uniref:Uncharacterized protein n=1 Tax=Toxocara canis TaxID=6265 RepID=A0A0B2VQZ4_TOXCA|nr:hypothetical protein Tcan_12273 [Toxocara canis]
MKYWYCLSMINGCHEKFLFPESTYYMGICTSRELFLYSNRLQLIRHKNAHSRWTFWVGLFDKISSYFVGNVEHL